MGIFSMLGSLGSAAIGAVSSHKSQQAANKAQAEENAKQREWQKAENDEARAYNKMLAEQQNKWNIEQWNRENAYNTPTAQMTRFAQAGLNPNLIYGQSNTAPQLSGSLTAGAPAEPTQGQFDTGIGDRMSAAGRDIASQLMQIPMYAAQVENLRAQTKKIEAETEGSTMDNAFNAFISNSSFDPEGIESALKGQLSPRQRRYLMDLWKTSKDIENVDEDTKAKALDNRIKDESFDNLVSKIESEAQISNSNARYLAATFLARVSQVKTSSELAMLEKEYQANKNEWMDFDRFAPIVLKSAEILGDFVGLKGFINAIVGNRKSKFGKMKQKGENTFEWE